MTSHPYLEHGLSFLHAHLQSGMENPASPTAIQPFITISRQASAGATTIGGELIRQLNLIPDAEDRPWIFLDKDLLTRALSQYQIPERLSEFLPEDRVSEITAVIGEIVGLHPSLWELEHRVSDAILQLALVGRVIFAGRAAHLVTSHLTGGFHVRLIAGRNVRIERLAALRGHDRRKAEVELDQTDQARARFVRQNFDREIDDASTYDLVINTERLDPATVVQLILTGLQRKLAALPPAAHPRLVVAPE